jgi:hypothetical protein
MNEEVWMAQPAGSPPSVALPPAPLLEALVVVEVGPEVVADVELEVVVDPPLLVLVDVELAVDEEPPFPSPA